MSKKPRISERTSLEDLAALVCSTLEVHGISVVLSGGAVVSIYSDAEYVSYDLDFVPTGLARKVDAAMLYAVPFMRAFGWAAMAVECLDQALVAKRIIDDSGETPLLKGKLLNLDFFVAHLLPQAIALAKTVRSSDESCLDESLFA